MKHVSLLIVITSLLLLAGCATVSKEEKPARPILEATLEELAAKINRPSENIRSLKAHLTLRYRELGAHGAQQCDGLLAYENPENIYLKGYRFLAPTFFTLVAKTGTFWVHLPKSNTVFTGRTQDLNTNESLEMGIRPDDLTRALILAPLPAASPSYSIEMQETPDKYVIVVLRRTGTDQFMERQIWVERYFLNVEKEIYYNVYGVTTVDITRRDYERLGNLDYPNDISIFRPDRGSTLFLKTDKLEINPHLNPGLFDFAIPEGAKVERLKET